MKVFGYLILIDHICIPGSGLEIACNGGSLMSFAFKKILRISLSCKLVPVHYREYEYGLLALISMFVFSFSP